MEAKIGKPLGSKKTECPDNNDYQDGHKQFSETLEDIYGFETSEGFIADVRNKIFPQIEYWQNRLFVEIHSPFHINAISYSVRDNGINLKFAAYMNLRINTECKKEVLIIQVDANKSSKYCQLYSELIKNRA